MKKLGVIFGGMSTENKVSEISAKSVLNNLNNEKYDVYPIYIDKNGDWFEYKNMNKIENIIEYLKNMDVIFPILHGLYGEDGTIQGMLELFKIPYVGCGVLASSVGMDKVYTKIIFEKAKINQANYLYIKKYNDNKFIFIDENFNEEKIEINKLINIVNNKLKYPVFIKPSNSGSSVGVNKAENNDELNKYIKEAFKYDNKILIEEGIIGKEVECAVLGNSRIGVEASRVGEIMSASDFYTFNAKYENKDSRTEIPANITDEQQEKIRELAIKAFNAIDGNGLSRVDFFVENNTGKIYINEINTMPGFTNISMYPKLMEDFGYTYSELLDKLIDIV
jgi:D-alanine-D-alanine ligase